MNKYISRYNKNNIYSIYLTIAQTDLAMQYAYCIIASSLFPSFMAITLKNEWGNMIISKPEQDAEMGLGLIPDEDFVGSMFRATRTIRSLHDIPRFGYPSDISLVASDTEEERLQYIYGYVWFWRIRRLNAYQRWILSLVVFPHSYCVANNVYRSELRFCRWRYSSFSQFGSSTSSSARLLAHIALALSQDLSLLCLIENDSTTMSTRTSL